MQNMEKSLDKPGINSSKYEAIAIQNAIKKLANIRSEVEAEVLAAVATSSSSLGKNVSRSKSTTDRGRRGQGGSGSSATSVATATASASTVTATAAQLAQSKRVFGPATKKLNVHPANKLYHDLLELNVPPANIKLKRPPQCEKRIDPAPCLQDYIQPQYCCIPPARDYSSISNYCKVDEGGGAADTNCADGYNEDDYFLIRSEPMFKYG